MIAVLLWLGIEFLLRILYGSYHLEVLTYLSVGLPGFGIRVAGLTMYLTKIVMYVNPTILVRYNSARFPLVDLASTQKMRTVNFDLNQSVTLRE